MDYFDSYYSLYHKHDSGKWPALNSHTKTDCCIVGGGIAGLSLARELLDRGLSVTVLESHRIAWGASGRNGGFVAPGFAVSYSRIQKKLGTEHANRLYKLSVEGVAIVRDNLQRFQMQNVLQSQGHLDVIRYNHPRSMQDWVNTSNRIFDLDRLFIERQKLQSGLGTDRYFSGVLQPQAIQIHPLNYCLDLAVSIAQDGGQIFEQTEARSVTETPEGFYRVVTARGRIDCRHLIHCSSAYTGSLEPVLQKSILPISTHVALTKPINNIGQTIMNEYNAVLDNRRASDYFRVVEGNRLLWGGGITTLQPSHKQLLSKLKNRMHDVFPQLKPAAIELGWNGLMGYTRHQMPLVGKIRDNTWVCTAFGGHGLNSASISARLIAKAIAENDIGYQLFAPFKPVWNFGKAGQIGVQLSYWAYQFGDWVDEYIRYR